MTTSDIFRGLVAFVLISLAIYLTWQRIKDVAERSKQENPQGAANPRQRQMLVIALILGLSLLAGGLASLLFLFLGR